MKNYCHSTKKSKKCIRKDQKIFTLPRKFSKKKCKYPKGFTMRSSCAPCKYCYKGGTKSKTKKHNAPLSSRTMLFTGSILFIFIVTHLSTFWYNFQITHDHSAYYQMVTSSSLGFGNIFITILYLTAMIILGFHLKHGFNSAIQTFGIKDTTVGKMLSLISIVFWFFVPAGFFSIAFWFGIMNGGIN